MWHLISGSESVPWQCLGYRDEPSVLLVQQEESGSRLLLLQNNRKISQILIFEFNCILDLEHHLFWPNDSWGEFFLQCSPELSLRLKKVQNSFLLTQLTARPWDWQVWKYELMLIRCTSGITTENSRGKDTPSHLRPGPDFLGCQASLQQEKFLIASDASEV